MAEFVYFSTQAINLKHFRIIRTNLLTRFIISPFQFLDLVMFEQEHSMHGHPLLCQAGPCITLLPVQVQAFLLVDREISRPSCERKITSHTITLPSRDYLLLA